MLRVRWLGRVRYRDALALQRGLFSGSPDDHLLLLKTNMGSGHFGPSGRYEGMKETAFDYAFLLSSMGITE